MIVDERTLGMTPGERAFADMAARGLDEATMLRSMRAEPMQPGDGTLVVRGYETDGTPVDIAVSILRPTPNLRTAFALALGSKANGMVDDSFRSRVTYLKPFIDFLVSRGLSDIKPRHITDHLLNQYRDWLDAYTTPERKPPTRRRKARGVKGSACGGKLKVDTKRRHMNELTSVLRGVRVDPLWCFELSQALDLSRESDWSGVANDRMPVEILTRPQLKMLVRVCREEVLATTGRLRTAWAVFDGTAPAGAAAPDDVEVLREVAALHRRFDGRPPKQQALSAALGDDERDLFPLLRRMKTQPYNRAIATMYPTGRLLMPFLLLFAICYRYNRSVVTTLRFSDFSVQPSVAGGSRLRGMPFKNRAGKTQYASWPVEAAHDNPAEMLATLERWTSSLRPNADPSALAHIFLERASGAKTRSLAVDHGFDTAFKRFLDDKATKLKRSFHFKAIRPSVISLVHHLFDGDLLATSEAGQHGVDVMVDHYLFDAARKANEESLVGPMMHRDAWRLSDGRMDAREDRRVGDAAAATPGFQCAATASSPARLNSPMPGQKPGAICTAYGMCPICPLGSIDATVPRNYVFVVRLREALLRSRARMSAQTWLGRWAPVLDRVELVTIRLFGPEVTQAADFDVPALPTME